MLEKIYHDKLAIQELRQGVLGKYVDDFALYLHELGYSKKQLRFRLAVIRRLSAWLTKNNVSLFDLNEDQLNQFIKIRAKQSKTFLQHGHRKILSFFINYLRLKKIIPQSIPVIPENESIERIIQAYTKYLDEDKGLCASTIIRNKKIIYDFLYKQFGKNEFIAKKITQNIILVYIIKFKEMYALKSLQVMVSVLRSFLRYLVMIGKVNVELANCIPAMPSWRAAHLPVFLVKAETIKLLKACDRRTPTGRRNYAILLLLMRLGLRASEVLKLTLDDINWDLSELEVRGKGRKRRVLPLPSDVGKAIASYIYYARPKCLDRHVFIRSCPPYKGLGNSSSISAIVRRALIAASLKPQQMGAHLLRYTAAMETLSNGATLFEIGELLGHCSVDTTAIYTKIDVVSLKELAQPWPIK
jgi:site-specific recombinase XerD